MEHYLPLITGSGGALVVLALVAWAFYAGKIHSDREFAKLEAAFAAKEAQASRLAEALATERATVNEQASAGRVNVKVMEALADIAAERAHRPAGIPSAEDVGL